MDRFTLILLIALWYATICQTNGASKYSVNLIPLPEEGDYKASGTVYMKGGMEPLFDFARSFIQTSLPKEFPNDFIKRKYCCNAIHSDILNIPIEGTT
ncbi:hypothetical protein ACJMK2_005353, partial [Sinanodonta woodiana]